MNSFKEDKSIAFSVLSLKRNLRQHAKRASASTVKTHWATFAPDIDGQLGLLHSPPKVKAFLKGDFSYYTDLYIKLQEAYRSESKEFPAVYYNAMLDLDAPFLLVLSACVPDDPDENAKVRIYRRRDRPLLLTSSIAERLR